MIRILASSLAVTAVLSMAANAPAFAAPSSKPKEIVVVGSKISNPARRRRRTAQCCVLATAGRHSMRRASINSRDHGRCKQQWLEGLQPRAQVPRAPLHPSVGRATKKPRAARTARRKVGQISRTGAVRVSRGQGEDGARCRITRSVVLPRSASRTPRCPAVGMPMKLTSNSIAASTIDFTTLPCSKHDRRQGGELLDVYTHGWRRASDMKKVHDDVSTGQNSAHALNRLDRLARCRRKVHRNQRTPELNVTTDLADKTARPRRNEQCRNGRAAGYGFRHRPPQPTLEAIAALGRKHDEIAGMLAQKTDDTLRRLSPLDGAVVNFNSKLGRDLPWRSALFRQSPLREQASRMRECQCSSGVMLRDMQEMQFAPGCQRDAQCMRKSHAAQLREIGRMHDRANTHSK